MTQNVGQEYLQVLHCAPARAGTHLPRVQVVVSLVDRLRHFLHACSVVLLINRYQLLSELIKKFDVVLVLVQLGVERLRREKRERVEIERRRRRRRRVRRAKKETYLTPGFVSS